MLLHSHELIPRPDVGHGGVPDPGAPGQVVLAGPDQLQQHVAGLGNLRKAICQVLRGVDIADLLDGLLLLDALPQLDDVAVQPVVLRGGFEMVDVGEETLIVGESDTL